MWTIIHLAVLALTVVGVARFLPGIKLKSSLTAVWVAMVFSVVNVLLGHPLSWLLHGILVLPAILTLGLVFLVIPFVVNAFVLWLTDVLIASFEITRGRTLLVASAIITVVNGLFHVIRSRF